MAEEEAEYKLARILEETQKIIGIESLSVRTAIQILAERVDQDSRASELLTELYEAIGWLKKAD
jgi:hypothetical protein